METKNFKYAVIGGLFGISATTYATAQEANAVCEQKNKSCISEKMFSVKTYEKCVSCSPGDKRYKRRRPRFVRMDPTQPTPPSGAPAMIMAKPVQSVTFLKAA